MLSFFFSLLVYRSFTREEKLRRTLFIFFSHFVDGFNLTNIEAHCFAFTFQFSFSNGKLTELIQGSRLDLAKMVFIRKYYIVTLTLISNMTCFLYC